ncbi:MAG: metallo-beta-lactamase family protein [Parcubacteria bacterium C7867-005]|nr:MAG: metallo-beta-lactamase family protein [Parcubacteria bacterium C7867-005]
MSKPTLSCFGGVGYVTGANFLLETETSKSLIDCGLLQGVENSDGINADKFDYDPATIDFLFITHAHIDHIGRVPKLVKDGFKGVIYSTKETKELSRLMLEDMARINESNAQERGVEPIYTNIHAEQALNLWQAIPYHESKKFADFSLDLFDAGHILGSAMYKFTFPSGKSMLFTGDLGNSPSPLLRDTEKIVGVDYILMDSVYGDRNHEDHSERDRRFKEIVNEVIAKKGTLLIPVFSLERTQVLLFELDNLLESKQIAPVSVFLDSPLAIRITAVYERTDSEYNKDVQKELSGGDDIFRFPKLRMTGKVRDSMQIANENGPKIILAGSGMSTAGRILGHEANFLPDPNATLLLVGYQAPGTLGRVIEEGAKQVTIKGQNIPVRARIEKIDGFSAHKGSDGLVDFVADTKDSVKKVFVTMGEPRSSIFLAQRLKDELDVDALVPERGKRYELDL